MYIRTIPSEADLLSLDEAAGELIERPDPFALLLGDKRECSGRGELARVAREMERMRLLLVSSLLRGELRDSGGSIRRSDLVARGLCSELARPAPRTGAMERCEAPRAIPQPAPQPVVLRAAEEQAEPIQEAPTQPGRAQPRSGSRMDFNSKGLRARIKALVRSVIEDRLATGAELTRKAVAHDPRLSEYLAAYIASAPKEKASQREKSFIRAFVASVWAVRPPDGSPAGRKTS